MLQLSVNSNKLFEINKQDDQLLINGSPKDIDIQWQSNGLISILFNSKSYTATVENVDRESKEMILSIDGQRFTVSIKEEIDVLLDRMGINVNATQKAAPVKAPMPGMVLKVLVEPGQKVNKGDGLIILEAMKMENVLKATAPATIKAIKIAERTAVEKGTILIEME